MFLIPGLLVRAVLDNVSGDATSGPGLWSLLAILAAAQIAAFFGGGLGGWYSHQHAQQTYATLARANLLTRLLRRPAATALPFPPAEALARFDSDVDQVSGQVVFLETIAEALVILIAVVLLWLLAGWVAALVVAPLVAIAVGASLSSSRLTRLRQALQESIGEVTTFLGGVFGALPVVRTSGAESGCVERFRLLTDTRRRAMLRDTLITQSLVSFSSQTYGIAIGVVLLLLAGRVQGGTLPVGDLALVVTYAGSVATVGSYLGGDLAAWRQYGVSLRRLGELLPGMPAVALAEPRPVLKGPVAAPTPPATPTAPFRSLEVRDLRCVPAGAHGISGVDLDLGPGELVVVTGRVGAGKSTLLRALLGMLPSEGVIRWNGTRVGHRPPSSSRPAAATWRRRRSCSQARSVRISRWEGRYATTGSRRRSGRRRWTATWPGSRRASRPRSGAGGSGSAGVRCSASRWRASWCSNRRSPSSTTSPAHSIRPPRPPSWRTCETGLTWPASRSRTVAGCWRPRTASSWFAQGGSRRPARSPSS